MRSPSPKASTRPEHEDEATIAPAELFFDLIVVFAVTQLSPSLLAARHARDRVLFLGIWWIWIFTVWATNRLDPETTPVRLLLFALMAAGLFVTMAPRPSAGAAIQVGCSLCVLAVLWRLRPENFRNFQRIFQRLGRPRRAPRPACRRTRAASPG